MTPLGDTATIAVSGSGESFGEMALVGGQRRSATVAALEESETFSIYQPDFEHLRREHPAVNDVLVQFLVSEVRMLNERLLEALYVPVERRVLRRLVELAALYPTGGGPPVITLTQEAIAELAGAARPTVNGVLRDEENAARSNWRGAGSASSISPRCRSERADAARRTVKPVAEGRPGLVPRRPEAARLHAALGVRSRLLPTLSPARYRRAPPA